MAPTTLTSIPPYVMLGVSASLVGFIFIRFARKTRVKRILWPLTVLVFAASLLSLPIKDPRFGWPFAVMMLLPLLFLYMRYSFCRVCGAIIIRSDLLRRPETCSHCGARLRADA